MTCHHARQQLAAYRRDDWTAADMRALADHLADCDSCRQTEATYRRVGESLRLLPTIMPDASFRESVFAAIAKEQPRVGPAAMLASRAETQPSLPVVRAPITPIRRRTAPTPVMRAAVAIAAVLALALSATQYLPSLGDSGFAANFFRGAAGLGATSASVPGIYANPDHVPFSASEFSANTVYRGWVGSSWVYVYAGTAHTNGSASQSGAVRVYDKHQTLVGVFNAPGATQWVRITNVHGDILTLVADTGATLTFNMTSNSFAS